MKITIWTFATLFASLALATNQIDTLFSITPSSSSLGRLLLSNLGTVYLFDVTPKTASPLLRFHLPPHDGAPVNPSWMVFVAPDLLYVVDVLENLGIPLIFRIQTDEDSNILRLYELDLATNRLWLKVEKEGSVGVVHLEFNADKTRLISSSYWNGTVDIWNTENKGLELMKTIKLPRLSKHIIPRPYQAVLDPTGRFAMINDLRSDTILTLSTTEDPFEVIGSHNIAPKECGPRHGVFYPKGADKATNYIVVCEKTSQVMVFSVEYNGFDLSLKAGQSISTFGEQHPISDRATAASIALTPDNLHLFVSNLGTGNYTDSISDFRITEWNDGTISLSSPILTSSKGLNPRSISISKDKDGDYLFVGNQDGENGLVAMQRDGNGMLGKVPDITFKSETFGGQGLQFVQQIL